MSRKKTSTFFLPQQAIALVLLLLIPLLLPACLQKGERNPNTFVTSSIGDARRLNPVIANDSASGTINDQVFNGLVKYDKDIKLIGDLAERWDISRDGKTITFHLRKGVEWHDGAPFTASTLTESTTSNAKCRRLSAGYVSSLTCTNP